MAGAEKNKGTAEEVRSGTEMGIKWQGTDRHATLCGSRALLVVQRGALGVPKRALLILVVIGGMWVGAREISNSWRWS